MKVCGKCKKEKDEEDFGKVRQRGNIYYKSYCKECEREYQAQYRKTHKRKYVYKYNKYEGVEK